MGCGGQSSPTSPPGDTPPPTECIPTSTPPPPTPTPPTPPDTPPPDTPPPPPDPNLFRISNEEVDAAGGMLNYLQGESNALLLARVGMGEGDDQNPTDREYAMWTVRVRAIVGLDNNLISPTSVKQESLAQGPGGSYQYLAIGALIAYGYPENIDSCEGNIKRMGYPCDQDLEAFSDTYNMAQTIVASDINAVPPALQGFDSFVGKDAGSEGKYCTWGEFKEGCNLTSKQLAEGNYFMDCVLKDNYLLGLIEEYP